MQWNDHERLRAKAAMLYYNEGMSQRDIAQRLQISPSKVFRLLADAKSSGVVQISIKQPISSCGDLEAEFERRYNLKEAIIINAFDDDNVLAALGQAAADYLKRIVSSDDIIGISWGRSLLETVNHLQPFGVEGTKVVQLVGGLNDKVQGVEAFDLSRRLAGIFGSAPELLHCPAVVTNPSVKEGLLQDIKISRVFELAKNATIALVGIGTTLPDSTLFRKSHIPFSWQRVLIDQGAVGDVCMRFFLEDGSYCNSGLDEIIMGICPEDLKNIKTVIGVAGCVEKALPLLGALRGSITDVLVTDKTTAKKVLELDRG